MKTIWKSGDIPVENTEKKTYRKVCRLKQKTMEIIKARKLKYDYLKYDDNGQASESYTAVEEIDLDIQPGQFISILGHNGSGKSTLAKHMNALLIPTEGTIWVDGMDTAMEPELWKIRQKAGMVFQNPDNQIIGTVVEEDVGFGPENLGIPTEGIWSRVNKSLEAVGMTPFRHRSPNKLSGGQKQRVAIAGVMAMHPKCIIMDEPTAMLDPNGRKEVLEAVHELNKKEGITVILITHYMEEVIDSDRVFVMDQGHIVMQGTPREIFSRVEELKAYRLDVPQVTLLAYELKKAGIPLPDGILTTKELVDGIMSLKLEHVTYTYNPGSAYETHALKDVSLEIPQGQFVGVIGHTGSGKSTLTQHFNGLMRPTSGTVYYNDEDIWQEGYSLKRLRSHVGLVFQYPEHQLFEADVLSDVCFGPKNQGLSQEEARERARTALIQVGLKEKYFSSSPFELSGGQKRRVAIAGVLAMEPDVLILDEPTAGLDPKGRDEILDQIAYLHQERKITVILVSHSMEDIARYVERILVMNQGEKAFDGTPKEVFAHYKELEAMGLAAPQITYIMHALRENGLAADTSAITVEEARDSILKALGRGEK